MNKLINSLEDPIRQSIILLMLNLIGQLLVLVFSQQEEQVANFSSWIITASFLLLYAFFTSVYLLKTDNVSVYVRNSLYGFLILLVAGFGLATVFSQLSPDEKRSIRWILFMIIFSYFVFLTIAFFMRKIIEYAQSQDTESKS
jgi:quinol-cytochrome oxidoreductase complex cytochrome b subunit